MGNGSQCTTSHLVLKVAIMPKTYGMFQLLDEHDSHEKLEGMPSRMYDFTYALVTFCDFDKASPNRSGHQIDSKRYPFEVHLVFFSYALQLGIDNMLFSDKKNDLVMVSVLGEISSNDNPKLTPMINAAKTFHGEDYGSNKVYVPVSISEQFSPLAFIPKTTGYYYYKGNFPIPPCFSIPRIYVLKTPMQISNKQLNVLTNMKSAREASGVLSCTFPLLQESTTENQILYNPSPIQYNKDDAPKNDAKLISVLSLTPISSLLSAYVIFSS